MADIFKFLQHVITEIFFWKTSNQLEVDFVLYGEKGIIAVEVKSSRRVNSSMFSGLKAFKADYPMARCFLVYGERREYNNGVEAVGAADFLKALPDILKGKKL